jgi:hypothetical protein
VRVISDDWFQDCVTIRRMAANEQADLPIARSIEQRHRMAKPGLMHCRERLFHVTRATRIVGRDGNQKQHSPSLPRTAAELSVTGTEKIV